MDRVNKKEKSVAIVILNYLNYKDTDECVQSILEQKYENYHVLIVDNGSENDSYRYLRKKYNKEGKVSIIRAGSNYGFAKGNNIGIYYIRKYFHCEYIMLLNNDTILEDCDYIKKMVEADDGKLGVIGSRIIERDCGSVRKYKRYVTFPASLFYYFALLSEYREHPISQTFWEKMLEKQEGVYIFRGCILLLTPAYFKFYKGLDPRTFLYCEEELLYLRCLKAGLKRKINDETYLFHKHKKSTKMSFGNDNSTYLKYMLSSYKYVLWESIKLLFMKSQKLKDKVNDPWI